MRYGLVKRLLNVALRGLSMGSKFVLIFGLAKLLEPKEVGLFGLMMATVSFSVLLVGADYCTYTQRELLSRGRDKWSFVIQHQVLAQLVLYCFLLPVLLLIFLFDLMDWQYSIWFFALLLVEHVSQEINRLLIVMGNQLMASCVLFVRIGSWVIVVLPLMYYLPEYRSLEFLFGAWFLGGLSAVLFGALIIKVNVINWSWYQIDFKWLKQGFRVGAFFLLASLCFRGLLTFDKYVVEMLNSAEILGVYVFYISLVIGGFSFLDPAVFTFLYPRLVESYQKQDKETFKKVLNELIISTLLISSLLVVFMWFAVPFIIGWIDKPIYMDYLDSLVVIIGVGFVFVIGHIPHYALYAMKGDKWIVFSHIASLLVFLLLVLLMNQGEGIETVTMALLLSFSCLFLIKSMGYIYTKRHSSLLGVK